MAQSRRIRMPQITQTGIELQQLTQPKFCWEHFERLTAERLERILEKEQYRTIPFWDRSTLSEEEKKQVSKFESITSFGGTIANLFEDMMNSLGYVPTQREYVMKGIEITQDWWFDNRNNPKVKGLPFNTVVRKACAERLARTWVSNIVELHTRLLIKDTMPHLKVYTHDLLDLVAGVDLVVEDDVKRYYVHIFKNTSWGMKAYQQKQKRGGLFKGNQFIRYQRDFNGDIALAYEWDTRTDHSTTKFINGIPLFKSEFIEWKFNIIKKLPTVGESLMTPQSKLDRLNDWLQHHFGQTVNFN